MKSAYQRIHIDKLTSAGTKRTTMSIESLSYEFLCLKMRVEPYSKESHKAIREWITEKMQNDPAYDPDADYFFSSWVKKQIIFAIADREIVEEWKEHTIIRINIYP